MKKLTIHETHQALTHLDRLLSEAVGKSLASSCSRADAEIEESIIRAGVPSPAMQDSLHLLPDGSLSSVIAIHPTMSPPNS